MEGKMTFWMCLLAVLYICNTESINANLIEKFQIKGNDLKKSTLNDHQLRSSACPLAEDIAPCNCSVDDIGGLNLYCDAVESEQQLAAVFQQDFPDKRFKTFRIYNNSNIENLHDIFNGVTFEYIDLHYVYKLNFINDYFLLGSVDTLKEILIFTAPNLITADNFPFVSLELYSHLRHLTLIQVPIGSIPKIRSQSLTWFSLETNEITSLEPGFLAGAPNVNVFGVFFQRLTTLSNGTFGIPEQDTTINIDVAYSQLQRIEPGAFYFANEASLKSTSSVDYNFQNNNLIHLEAGVIKLRNGYTSIILYYNSIKVIEKGAFELPAITDRLWIYIALDHNKLTTIDENVFGELMPFVYYLSLSGNPLACGCDIFWLISNPDYMKVLSSSPTCADGTLIADLDVQEYEELCT